MDKTNIFLIGKPGKISSKLIECNTWEEFCETTFEKFNKDKKNIETRYKEVPQVVAHYTESVRLYGQARDLYCLGYFDSAIVVCRAAAEYLALELFVEQIDLDDDREKIEQIAENLDFRKIVDNFLFNKNKPLINKDIKDIFHKIYDIGNKWIHPKKDKIQSTREHDAKNTLLLLTLLMNSTRSIFVDAEIINGCISKKPNSTKRCNGIRLAEDQI